MTIARPVLPGRRDFLQMAGAALAAAASGCSFSQALPARRDVLPVRIASNPGLENATLNQLIAHMGFLDDFGVSAEFISTPGTSGPIDALSAGRADICLVSGYNRLIPDIVRGARVKIVAGAMLLPALTIYSSNDEVRSVHDLTGRRVGVGPELGLLHALMILRLKKAGIEADAVEFVRIGGNAAVYKAIVAGEVDAGLASISNMASAENDGVHLLAGGSMWTELPEYTFQTAYASDAAIAQRRTALVRTLAAYARLYQFLQTPASRSDFFSARRAAEANFDEASADTVWRFIQDHQPYSTDLVLSESRLNTLQRFNVSVGLQEELLAVDEIADMSLAADALALLRG